MPVIYSCLGNIINEAVIPLLHFYKGTRKERDWYKNFCIEDSISHCLCVSFLIVWAAVLCSSLFCPLQSCKLTCKITFELI